jgi:signal transduction histidine kinase
VTAPSPPRLARPLHKQQAERSWWRVLVGGALIVVATFLAIDYYGVGAIPEWLIPLGVYGVALVLVWSPLDGALDGAGRRISVTSLLDRGTWARILLGVAMAIGAMWWFATWEFSDEPLLRIFIVPLALVAATALLLGPWWLRLLRQLGVERDQRIREYERAEIAAHLHDSVLQTLTLIRAKAEDPDAVARLARAQERDLRSYLYQERGNADATVAAAVAHALSELEDAHGVVIDSVTVGDAPLDPQLGALVKAVREAASNAARHGIGPISVYVETTTTHCEVFVRDNGPGYDQATVPADRLGIRESIIGRMTRHGGQATVQSAPGARTEVHLVMPRGEQ